MERVNENTKFQELVFNEAYKIYGKPLSEEIQSRLEKEIQSILDNNFVDIYMLAYKLVKLVKKDGYSVMNRGTIGSSLVAYCLDITEVDPIKYNIPFETFSGKNGDKKPNIALCVPHNYKQQLEKYIDDKYLEKKIFEIYESKIPSILYKLRELTDIDPITIPLDDAETLNMICSCKITDIDYFNKANHIILETHPTTFEDLVRIFGLVKGTDVWQDNAQNLIKDGTATLSELITTRDDIMTYLISVGMNTKRAFEISELVKLRDNKIALWLDYANMMRYHNVPEWYITSCKKVSYLFSKAHAVGYMINYFRLAWYKVHYTNQFKQVIKEFSDKESFMYGANII